MLEQRQKIGNFLCSHGWFLQAQSHIRLILDPTYSMDTRCKLSWLTLHCSSIASSFFLLVVIAFLCSASSSYCDITWRIVYNNTDTCMYMHTQSYIYYMKVLILLLPHNTGRFQVLCFLFTRHHVHSFVHNITVI